MSTYQYTCLNQSQQRDVGTLEASSQGVAANILRERGLRVLELIEVDLLLDIFMLNGFIIDSFADVFELDQPLEFFRLDGLFAESFSKLAGAD